MTTTTLVVLVILAMLAIGIIIFVIKQSIASKEYDVEYVQDAEYDEENAVLTFKGGRTGETRRFTGSCTVWHYENGRSCDVFLERQLSEIWHYCKRNNK